MGVMGLGLMRASGLDLDEFRARGLKLNRFGFRGWD